ncbi:helix-turn-helix transcriptional regulator [Klebsiella pneumoniae]|uniref:helix-turn-helix transcriptional regulator n=1 Tax=Klebsiella pneumoniae TaxID=573 RepID=UPI001E5A3CE8|nr:helix-turn-helix transcriptional regulator [Klebsiella pneumoniae]
MPTSKYLNEIKINPNQGGKAAIERLVKAYGFTTRQALADHLGVSKSTLANRYMRDTFPADWIIQCALPVYHYAGCQHLMVQCVWMRELKLQASIRQKLSMAS